MTDPRTQLITHLTKIAADCHRSKWQFDFNPDEVTIPAAMARKLVSKAFDELHRIGDEALKVIASEKRSHEQSS